MMVSSNAVFVSPFRFYAVGIRSDADDVSWNWIPVDVWTRWGIVLATPNGICS